MKKQFILDEVMTLSFMGAFQRANIYNKNATEEQRKSLKKDLAKHLDKIVFIQYHQIVSEEQHIQNILSISEFTANKFSDILQNRKLNFGVSQKLLNLYLKYLWCLDEIPTPPHFPIDSIIQQNLQIKTKYSWTKINSKGQYLSIINEAKEILKHSEYNSLAELELNEFNRR